MVAIVQIIKNLKNGTNGTKVKNMNNMNKAFTFINGHYSIDFTRTLTLDQLED